MEQDSHFIMITDEEGLSRYLERLRRKNVGRIALDMEGDQGMFRYNHSISILQCYDGDEAAVIDVLKMGNNDTLVEFLTCQDIVKVMFSCGNDLFMSQNVIGCTITPVNDISIAQKLLGMPINLANYLHIDKDVKDGFQRANWLTRPIKPALLEYAVNDVLKLLEIEDDLTAQLKEKGLYKNYIDSSRAASEKNYAADRHKLFELKFPGYMRMPFEKKKAAAAVWIFRELLGERLDCPVGYVLSKKAMASIVNEGGELVTSLEREINRGRNPNRRLAVKVIRDLLGKAMQSPDIPDTPTFRKKKTTT